MKRAWLVAALLVTFTVAVFLPVAGHRFVLFDDDEYVTDNPVVSRGLTAAGVRWAFTTLTQSNWHPLAWVSHMLDVQAFGLAPRGHHLTSLALHAATVALLFLALRGMTGALWRPALVAALFAVHPLHVESVAWVAERKDVLAGFFWVLALGAYLRYARVPTPARALAVLLCSVLGLLAKPMVVTLPFVLLLLDWWPLGRLGARGGGRPPARARRLVLEKAPLFALSAASSLVTYVAQLRGGSIAAAAALPLAARCANAVQGYLWYLGKALWPSGLAVLYPHPGAAVAPGKTALALGVVAGCTAAALLLGRRRPWLTTGWLWYLGTLVPVIGFVQIGLQSTADRYSYLPLIGVFVAAAWTLGAAARGRPSRRLLPGAAAALALIALAAASRLQLSFWRDDLALFGRAVAVTRDNPLAWLNLGAAHARRGEWEQEIAACREALRVNPGYADAWFNLGLASFKLGRYQESRDAYGRAVTLRPGFAQARQGLAEAAGELARQREAAAERSVFR
jgi:tetratricopeptide (TPR) repeat protein